MVRFGSFPRPVCWARNDRVIAASIAKICICTTVSTSERSVLRSLGKTLLRSSLRYLLRECEQRYWLISDRQSTKLTVNLISSLTSFCHAYISNVWLPFRRSISRALPS